jgi:hypothetical protein
MPFEDHDSILKAIGDCAQILGTHRLEFPASPVIGSYKPDFLWYVDSQGGHLAIIGEVESSDYSNKDIPGACLLADNLAARMPCVHEPLLAFVVPDGISIADMGHVEERLNIAASRMRKIIILPAMRASKFIEWFKQRRQYEEQRVSQDGQFDRTSKFT